MNENEINEKLTCALKSKDGFKLKMYRAIKARFQEVEKSKDDVSFVSMINKMISDRKNSQEAYEKVNAHEKAKIESDEAEFLKQFLPVMLDEKATQAAVACAIKNVNASSMKDMKSVINDLKASHGESLNMKLVSSLIKKGLQC